jgi:hypothetical protein
MCSAHGDGEAKGLAAFAHSLGVGDGGPASDQARKRVVHLSAALNCRLTRRFAFASCAQRQRLCQSFLDISYVHPHTHRERERERVLTRASVTARETAAAPSPSSGERAKVALASATAAAATAAEREAALQQALNERNSEINEIRKKLEHEEALRKEVQLTCQTLQKKIVDTERDKAEKIKGTHTHRRFPDERGHARGVWRVC